jgi:AcrR family transcriptional regulator
MPRVVAEHGLSGTTVAHIVAAAGVGRATFYDQFADKQECFAIAYERAQERLLGALTFPCYTKAALPDRVGAALSSGFALLAREPDLAVLIAVEAPAAGSGLVDRHLQWMKRYGELLRLGVLGVPEIEQPLPSSELMIVGGIATGVAERILAGEVERLPELAPSFIAYTLNFYRGGG